MSGTRRAGGGRRCWTSHPALARDTVHVGVSKSDKCPSLLLTTRCKMAGINPGDEVSYLPPIQRRGNLRPSFTP